MEQWSQVDSLETEYFEYQYLDHANGALYSRVAEGRENGSITYPFRENKIDPIPVTPSTRWAWSWKVSKIEDTNGFWINLSIKDTVHDRLLNVRCVNWIEYTNQALYVFYDPPLTWVSHEVEIFDYLWKLWGPFSTGDLFIEAITLFASKGKGVEAWVDNIWIGEGDPPDSVLAFSDRPVDVHVLPSRLTGFSYAYLDHGWEPDRVDIYRDRAEIVMDPHAGWDARSETKDHKGVVVHPKRVFQTIKFDPQRGDGSTSIADLDDDGRSDVLFHFDDLLGSRCYKNMFTRGRFEEVCGGAGRIPVEQEHCYGSAIADIDLDGDVDLLLFNPFCRRGSFGGVRILKNEGGFLFTDWTEQSRILSECAFGAAFGDVDGDDDPDLFVGYRLYGTAEESIRRPYLYINDGSGRFSTNPESLFLPGDICIEGGLFADFDNDADLDLYVVVSEVPGNARPPRNRLLLNDGTGRLTDMTEMCGAGYPYASQSAIAEDFDHDGYIDLYVINSKDRCVYYRNRGGLDFVEVARGSDFDCSLPVTAGVGADVDADGDVDIVLLGKGSDTPILKKNRKGAGYYIHVRLKGVGGNSQGIGGKVYLYESGHLGELNHLIGFREINCGRGFAVHGPPVAVFGLGGCEEADLLVSFPPVNGKPSTVIQKRAIAAGSFVEIVESTNRFSSLVHHRSVDYFLVIAESFLFRFPDWLVSIVVFAAVAAVGITVRNRALYSWYRAFVIAVILLMALLAAAAIARSPRYGIPAVVLSLVAVAFGGRLDRFFRSVLYPEVWREKMEEILLENLSQAIHMESGYAFLVDLERLRNNPSRSSEIISQQNFKSLEKLVKLMRICAPADRMWRQTHEEVMNLKKVLDKMLDNGDDLSVRDSVHATPDISLLHHSLSRLKLLFSDCRATLRWRYSVSFSHEWRRLIDDYDTYLKSAAVSLVVDFPDSVDKVHIHVKKDELRHIFENMLRNSVYAMEHSLNRKIKLRVLVDEIYLIVEWQDTGPGIPADVREKLFREPVRSTRLGGRGEGCHISYQIMKHRGGYIRTEQPHDGMGALFILKFIRLR